MPPDLIDMAGTCAFLPRCQYRIAECEQKPWPELKLIDGQHYVSCYANTQEKQHDK
jgi:oligopeptide/dipeptide ABC transporter ATP-binding protein